MTPIEKARELVSNYEKILKLDYKNYYKYNFEHCRKCALIAVDELIMQEEEYNNGSFYPSNYWQQVKAELEKL